MRTRAKRPRRKLDENDVRVYKIQSTVALLATLIRWTGACVLATVGIYLPIKLLAGNATIANIAVEFLADFRINTALAWLLAGGGVAYGGRQRRLRVKTIERLEGHIRKLEKKADRRRSSSKLTQKGLTNPGDAI